MAPYLTIDPTIPYFSMWLVINNKTWDKLSNKDQKIIAETAKGYEAWTRDFAAKECQEDFAFLKTKTKAFTELSKEQKTKLINIVKPVMKDFSKNQLGDQYQKLWNLLEESK